MSTETEQLFARFFVEENQSECYKILDEIGRHPLTERSVRSLSSKLMSSQNSNIRKKIVCFLGERLKTSPYTCDIANILRRVVDCDESAPVRSTAIEYLQTLEQKRSFSSISALLRPKSPTGELRFSQDSQGYESDEFASSSSSSSSPKLSPPSKKKGRLASLISKVEHANMVRKENDEKEISKMNRALEEKAKLAEASRPRKTGDLSSWFGHVSDDVTKDGDKKKQSDDIAKQIIDLTEDSKYVGDDGDDAPSQSRSNSMNSSPSKTLLTSLQTSKTSPKTSQVLSTSILSRDILSGYNTSNRQKSSSLPFCIGEKTIHTKRVNEHPILHNGSISSNTGGISRGGILGKTSSSISRDPGFGLPLKAPPRVDPMDALPLSKDQEDVIKLAATQQSFFFTGAAGTGKSFVLRRVVQAMKNLYGSENVFVTASTGMAACNIGGITLHSFAGIGLGNRSASELARQVLLSKNHRARWNRAKCLIVDEVSMISGELFDKLEIIARTVRRKHLPFGGIQVILCGDFFQLPPVFEGGEEKYCFEAESWDLVVKKCVELKTVFRQKDQSFIQLLNEVRIGRISQRSWLELQKCCTRELPRDGVEPTRLYPHRSVVETENQRRLKELPSVTEQTYRATDECATDSLRKILDNLPVPSLLTLRVGAQVILLKNLDSRNELVNGAQGIVETFYVGTDNKLFPVVRFKNGVVAQIEMDTWNIESGGTVVASRKQIPLGLAWAISIHKSQGMTLSKVVMRLENIFSEGQAYVALSRVKSLDGLKIEGRLPSQNKFRPNQKVLDFYTSFNNATGAEDKKDF